MIIRQALAEAAAAGTSALDASLLLASMLNTNRSSLLADDVRPLDEASLAAFRALVKRRLAGECTAYILGKKEFYGLDFQVTPAVLVPRPDTETLVETALGVIKQLAETNQEVRVLDLCTGSGAVAIALKHTMPELEVWATDISDEALDVARANADRLLPPDSIHFCHGDLFGALPRASQGGDAATFHLIVSNPPYIPTAEIAGLAPEVRGEPFLALDGGGDGLSIISRIISGAPQFLNPTNQRFAGALLLEADPRQMQRIAALLMQAGFTDIQTRRDLSGAERVIGAFITH
jgi:release factor glutamine methyltransferase